MLNINNKDDIIRMKAYHRTSDMINLIEYFPEICPVRDLTIIENESDYRENFMFIKDLDNCRVDSLKDRDVLLGIEHAGKKDEFLSTLKKVKEKDPYGVLVLFNVNEDASERYNRYAGISIGVDVLDGIYIDAVGKGFDGREVSKGICTHERYYIPWFELRKCSVQNFKDYKIYQISDEDYKKTRVERMIFLKSIGLNEEVYSKMIPEVYEKIPGFIWENVVRDVIKLIEKQTEVLVAANILHFAISGHTEGKKFCAWQMYDKTRYCSKIKQPE